MAENLYSAVFSLPAYIPLFLFKQDPAVISAGVCDVNKHRGDEVDFEIVTVFFRTILYGFFSKKRYPRAHPLVEIKLRSLVTHIAVCVALGKMQRNEDL